MTYSLKYDPTTPYGTKFPHWVIATYPTRTAAEAARQECPGAAGIVVVPSGAESAESALEMGGLSTSSGKISGYSEGPGRANEPDPSRHRSTTTKGA